MIGHFLSDRGKVRSHNEDSGGVFFNDAGQLLAIIADGMGGHQAGDVASEMATTFIEEKWQQKDSFSSPEQVEEWLGQVIEEVNDTIYKHSLEKEECQGMGTTLVAAVCTSEYITVAHIGDSRCYLYDQNEFKQLTEDHSLVNALVQSGQITKEEANHHPRKNVVLKALGTEASVESDIQTISWEEGDKLLLCSDGLTDKVLDDEILEYLKDVTQGIEEIGQQLVDLANDRGGEDNVSLIIVKHEMSVKVGEN
ncbi:Stp1/IreP family PP2C-type Ser/Thr phosphatase [Ornithinibacillus sp. L9]|uniref:protein-serine/threonine phosphatase n=1 Tax=Ornithinibacillus caprae TaxID=2678566 RepID=A0A6N8FII9_9BACI|nr:Stp1/IreP family PP2C-type Ser/Thr phosphatase [Ornithinibacillus caprae]MUK89482.1 Stp1/IreP family PP2C-type Ser/Thr phosphatase [Ornithinibacillus caprae]